MKQLLLFLTLIILPIQTYGSQPLHPIDDKAIRIGSSYTFGYKVYSSNRAGKINLFLYFGTYKKHLELDQKFYWLKYVFILLSIIMFFMIFKIYKKKKTDKDKTRTSTE